MAHRWLAWLMLCATAAHAASPTNRADEYRRAYQELQASAKNLELVEHWSTSPLDEEHFQLLAQAGPALAIAIDATFLPDRDWKLRATDLNADASHREAVRTLVRLLGMRARHGLRETTRTDLAMQDAVSAIVMARDLSRDGTLTSALIARKLESEVIGMLMEQAPRLSAKDRARLAEDLAAIGEGVGLAEAIVAHERSMRLGLAQATRGASTRKQLVARLERFPMLRPVAPVLADGCGRVATGFARCLEQLRLHYAAWSKWFAMTPAEFAAEYEKDVVGLEANPMFRLVTPSIAGVQQAEYAYQQQRRRFEEVIGAPGGN